MVTYFWGFDKSTRTLNGFLSPAVLLFVGWPLRRSKSLLRAILSHEPHQRSPPREAFLLLTDARELSRIVGVKPCAFHNPIERVPVAEHLVLAQHALMRSHTVEHNRQTVHKAGILSKPSAHERQVEIVGVPAEQSVVLRRRIDERRNRLALVVEREDLSVGVQVADERDAENAVVGVFDVEVQALNVHRANGLLGHLGVGIFSYKRLLNFPTRLSTRLLLDTL